jgi:hypothetical protein
LLFIYLELGFCILSFLLTETSAAYVIHSEILLLKFLGSTAFTSVFWWHSHAITSKHPHGFEQHLVSQFVAVNSQHKLSLLIQKKIQYIKFTQKPMARRGGRGEDKKSTA